MTALVLFALQTFSLVGRGITFEDLLSVPLCFIGDTGIVKSGLVTAELVVGKLSRHNRRSLKGRQMSQPHRLVRYLRKFVEI